MHEFVNRVYSVEEASSRLFEIRMWLQLCRFHIVQVYASTHDPLIEFARGFSDAFAAMDKDTLDDYIAPATLDALVCDGSDTPVYYLELYYSQGKISYDE